MEGMVGLRNELDAAMLHHGSGGGDGREIVGLDCAERRRLGADSGEGVAGSRTGGVGAAGGCSRREDTREFAGGCRNSGGGGRGSSASGVDGCVGVEGDHASRVFDWCFLSHVRGGCSGGSRGRGLCCVWAGVRAYFEGIGSCAPGGGGVRKGFAGGVDSGAGFGRDYGGERSAVCRGRGGWGGGDFFVS